MSYHINDIRNIAYTAITERFSKGSYLGLELTIDMTTGYIHGGHLVSQAKTSGGKPKQFIHWNENKSTIFFKNYLASIGIPISDQTYEISDVANELRGTYIHPRLISHLAQWASPEFADKVGIILNSKAITEAISAKDETISRLEKIMADITEQNKYITRQNEAQSREIQEQSRQIQELLGYAKKADADLTTAREEMEEYREEAREENAALQEQVETSYKQTQILSEQVFEVSTKLDIAVVRRVPPELEDCKTEYFGICRNPSTNKYRVYRCQKRGRKAAIKRCADDGFTVEVYCKEDPSSVSNFNRVKKQLPPSIGVVIGFRLTLSQDATEQQLLDFITKVDDQRRDV